MSGLVHEIDYHDPSRTPILRIAGRHRRLLASHGHRGPLLKEGRLVPTWKHRFFVLSHGVLRYYADEKAATNADKSLGEFHLPGSTVSSVDPTPTTTTSSSTTMTPPPPPRLRLSSRDRTLVLQADDRQSLQEWRRQIQEHIDLSNEDLLLEAAREGRRTARGGGGAGAGAGGGGGGKEVLPPGLSAWMQGLKEGAIEASIRLRKEPQLFCKIYTRPLGLGDGRHARLFTMSKDGMHLLWGPPGKQAQPQSDDGKEGLGGSGGGGGSLSSSVAGSGSASPPPGFKSLPVGSVSSVSVRLTPSGSGSRDVVVGGATVLVSYVVGGSVGVAEDVLRLEAADGTRAMLWAKDVETVCYYHAIFGAWEGRRVGL